jgi:hypothetical protein
MKLFKRLLAPIVLTGTLILINGCATSGLSAEPMTFNKEYLGMVVGSITFPEEKARYNQYFFNVEAIANSEKASKRNSKELQITPNQITRMRHAGELEGGKTYLFALEKVPGKYKFSRVRLSTVGMGYAIPDDLIQNFTIPFDIKKGEITYVGEIKINEYARQNDTLINLKDNFERDINAIKTKQPGVNWDIAKKSNLQITTY